MFNSDRLESILRDAVSTISLRDCSNRGDRPRSRPRVEILEFRLLFSGTNPVATPPVKLVETFGAINSPANLNPSVSAPYAPADVTGAYGVSSISFSGTTGNGSGQTVAIIDAFNDPNIVSDVSTFSARFGLPQFDTAGNPTFTVLNQTGGTALPSNTSSSTATWDLEVSLDVEWAHAIAPMANIVLFEANSATTSNLFSAAQTAGSYSGVSVVSMSFGSSEFGSESSFDYLFTTPTGHQGVTFIASTGDSGAPAEYPAYSPNVLAVGGTSLSINSGGSYGSESAWSSGGGGASLYESQPSYQSGKVNGLSSTKRTAPDVSMLADPNTGVYVYDSWAGGTNTGGYSLVGGTSLSAPMWAGLIAIADQGRVINGLGTLDGPSQTLPMLYQLPSSDFHDITSGNNGFNAGTGYDLATGLGTPVANLLIPSLVGSAQPVATHLAFSTGPSNCVAGSGISPSITVQVLDASGNLVSTDSSSITLSIGNDAAGGTLSGTTTVTAINGVATFSGLWINKAGSGYTLVASDGSLTNATSGAFTIGPGAATQLVVTNQPVSGTVGVAMSSAVVFSIEDSFGNVCSTNGSTVTLSLASGAFVGGSNAVSAGAANGVVTFSGLTIRTAGTFAFTAAETGLTSATTNSFMIAKATPNVAVFEAGGIYNALAYAVTSATVTDAGAGITIASLGSGLLSYRYYTGTLTTSLQVAGATPLSGAPVNAGSYTVVASFAGNANYNPASSGEVNFTVSQRTLHVTASGQSRIYNATNSASVTFSDDRVFGDLLSINDSTCTFTSSNAGNAIAINVTGIALSGTVAPNYVLASTTATTSADITALPITGSITVSNKVYDGTTSASILTRSLSGVLGSDSVSLVGGTATFNSKDVATATTITATGLAINGAQASNYILSNSTESAAARITPRAVTGSIAASSKVYDGTTAANVSMVLAGVLPGDSVWGMGGNTSFASKDVGTAITVTSTHLVLGGPAATDYLLSNTTESTTANITPLTISGSFSVEDKVYDGSASAVIASRTLSGAIYGDSVSLSGGDATFNSADVSSATSVTATGLVITGGQAGDYILANPIETIAASMHPLGVSGTVTVADKLYDGFQSATLVSRSLSGVLGADGVSLAGGSALFNTAAVGNEKPVAVTGLALAGPDASNYVLLNPTESATASILPLQIGGTVYNTTAGTLQSNLVTSNGGTAGAGIANRIITLAPMGHTAAKRQIVKTDASGNFVFSNLAAGNYLIKVMVPPHWRNVTFPTAGLLVTVRPGASVPQVMLGQSDAGKVAGSVFLDSNNDGRRQAREHGLAGWTVNLTMNGTTVQSADTDAQGNFSFADVTPGNYQLAIVEQSGYMRSAKARSSFALLLTPGKAVSAMNFGQQPVIGFPAKLKRRAA